MLDLIIICIFILFVFLGYWRGMIRMVFGLFSFGLSVILAIRFYPVVAEWLRTTQVYFALKDYIIRTMNLESAVNLHAEELIMTLPLPGLLVGSMLEHHTPNMFNLLQVQTIEEFIAGFFAGMAINIITMFLIFVIIRLFLGLLSGLLDIVGRLPVIRTFNHGGGLILGAIQGVVVIWIGLSVLNLFFLNPTEPGLSQLLNNSLIAGWVYENNPIMILLAMIQ